MERRSFLKILGVGLAALTVSPKMAFDALGKTAPPASAPIAWNFTPANSFVAQRWAKHWWKQASEENYFYEFLGPDNMVEVFH